jgi:hypothetical protein
MAAGPEPVSAAKLGVEVLMSATLTPLIREFLTWIDRAPRSYAEVMEGWRTSCPRLTVWEDAVDQGLVARSRVGPELMVELTEAGRSFLLR